MAKRNEAEQEDDGDKIANTTPVRIEEKLAEMLGWICQIEGKKQAEVLDPLIRAQIVARHAQYLPAIERIKKAQSEIDAVVGELKRQAADQLPPGRKGKR